MDINFFAYRHDNHLRDVFTFKGKVLHEVNLSAEKWLMVKLLKPITYLDMNVEYALIQRADKGIILRNKDNQLVHFKLAPQPELIKEGMNDISNFPYEIWALCR